MGSGYSFVSFMAIKLVFWILLIIFCIGSTNQTIITPGCYLKDYQYEIVQDGCWPQLVLTKLCTGYCRSITVASRDNSSRMETRAACCTIKDYERIPITLDCMKGIKSEFELRSPTACECFDCKMN